MSMPLLSIVCTFYNGCAYTQDFLTSLELELAQDKLLEQTEIILVDDGSTDGTPALLDEFCSRHETAQAIHQNNEGAWRARLAGISKAHGVYLQILDGDDLLRPHLSHALLAPLLSGQADISICGFERFGSDSGATLSREMCFDRLPLIIEGEKGDLLSINTALWNKCFKRELVAPIVERYTAEGAFVPARVVDDAFMFLSVVCGRASVRVAFVNDALVKYRVHAKGSMQQVSDSDIEHASRSFMELKTHAHPAFEHTLDVAAFIHLGLSLQLRALKQGDSARRNKKLMRTLSHKFPSWKRPLSGEAKSISLARICAEAHLLVPALKTLEVLPKLIGKDIKW